MPALGRPRSGYATQQDNTTISTPSTSTWGAITLGDCTYPGTGESGFVAVHPEDPNIVYCGAIGSSPGGAGALQRYDHRAGQLIMLLIIKSVAWRGWPLPRDLVGYAERQISSGPPRIARTPATRGPATKAVHLVTISVGTAPRRRRH